MRLCLVTGEFPPLRGGVGDYTAFLAGALADRGHEVTVLTTSRARPDPHPGLRPAVTVLPLVPHWGWRGLARALQALARLRPAVVHLQYQTAAYAMHPAITLLPLTLRRWPDRPRVVVTYHDLKVPYLFPKAGPLRRLPGYLLGRLADAVITTNPEDCRALAGGSPTGAPPWPSRLGTKLYQIPIGSNIPVGPPAGYRRDQWRARLGAGREDLLIAYFGFIQEWKGVEVLATAFEQLVHQGLPVRLVMLGARSGDSGPRNRAYLAEVHRRLARSPLRERVTWTGYASAAEISAGLLAADVGALPFRNGASLRHGTLVAALVHGLPTVTTRPPGEAGLRDGEHVLFVPPGDAPALAQALARLGADPDLRARLSAGARRLAEDLAWPRIAAATEAVYHALLTAQPLAGR